MGSNFLKKKRNIDIVFCIDGTGSMRYCIDNVKKHTANLYQELKREIENLNSEITSLRVKYIIFRDYASDKDHMEESRFFEMPSDAADASEFLKNVTAHGGCDEDANGLEALYYAMKSDFNTGENDRQIIVLFGDTGPIPLLKRKGCPGYDKDMPNEKGLSSMWGGTDQAHPTKLKGRLKRMLIYAPVNTYYQDMGKSYDRFYFNPVEPYNGMEDIDFSSIIKTIAASASA